MSNTPTVTIFNASYLGVQMSVNSGQQFSINPAAGPNWTPQTPTSGGPTWNNQTPGQNVIAPGDNYLNIIPTGGLKPFNTVMSLPGSMQWSSLQIYIFFNSYSDVSWIALNNGEYVTGNLKLGSSHQIASPDA
ncbi:hypothetical protein [Mangrovicella endophytica]|uniref:hypothetical protein n=1 Tax=Mangrovicella endophytica TaxID=2066697 RepID=UPI000C9DC2B7|nr:hypothetical protein [Mangrovicella endophytica]